MILVALLREFWRRIVHDFRTDPVTQLVVIMICFSTLRCGLIFLMGAVYLEWQDVKRSYGGWKKAKAR